MATNLAQVLDFSEAFRQHRMLLIASNDLGNSSFVLSSLVQSLARNPSFRAGGGRAWFVLFSQSYLNLSCVQMKCGMNLKPLRDAGGIGFFDVLSQFAEFTERSRFSWERFQQAFTEKLQAAFDPVDEKSRPDDKSRPDEQRPLRVICIDDLSCLLALGVSLKEVFQFLQRLRRHCRSNDIRLLVQTFQDEHLEDDRLTRLLAVLKADSSLWLQVSKLETGYSKHVDGTLQITDQLASQQKRYLFKCTERATKLHAPGYTGF